MKSFLLFLLLLPLLLPATTPTQGLCIAAPTPEDIPRFLIFIEELAPKGLNTLVLRVDYRYEYKGHPELRADNALTEAHVKQMVQACKAQNVRLIPQINLLGHQSWHSELSNLLTQYPQFDETPHVELPPEGTYKWPNPDGLYCKSYCPLHPEVHGVVFDLVDEIIEVFEADAFHAGMDEVFYLGDDQCPRCKGKDKAELFAGEVSRISYHLQEQGAELWIWGDRLIDGYSTGMGMWEASHNDTYRAIDLIPKEVVINDWHYEMAYPTAAYFAMKGLRVVSCPWRKADVGLQLAAHQQRFRETSPELMKDRYAGTMETVWSSMGSFLSCYYGEGECSESMAGTVACFKALVEIWE